MSVLSTAAVLVGCAIAGQAALAAGGQGVQRIRIGQAPQVTHGARQVGAVAASTRFHLTVALRPRDGAALAAYAKDVSTPGSSVYRVYLTPAQFAQRFGATSGQVAAVSSSMHAHGLGVGPVSANRLSIPLTGTAAQIERAFSLTFRRMQLADGKQAVMASAAPALDPQIAGDVQAVIGLSTVSAPKPLRLRPSVLRPAARARLAGRSAPRVATGGPQPCSAASSAASSQGAYTADQIASAYRFSSLYGNGDQGQGVTIALYELEPNDPNDIAAYQACYGTKAPVSYVQVDGGPGGSGPGSGEAALDIEQSVGLAPKANFLVYQGPNAGSSQNGPGSGPYDTLNAIVSQDRAQVVSISWGECEQLEGSSSAQSESSLFQEAAAQGQSVVVVAGDEGSEDCNQANGVPDPGLAVDDPGSQPFVTSVGGTTLSSLGPPPGETVWNNAGNATGLLGIQGGAGGGGISQIWEMPGYQSGAAGSLHVIGANSSGSSCGNANGGCRQVPDVAADADPSTGYIVYVNGAGSDPTQPAGWQAVGGTSAGAPLWAALLADIDSSSACHGSAVGFANPALYRAAGSAYGSYFNDITVGNNDLTGTNNGLYPAGPAYDMATGLGTPNAGALASALCADTLRVDNPGTQVATVGQPVSLQIKSTGPPGAKLSYAASHLPPGLTISKSTGRITGKPTRAGSWVSGVAALDQSLALRAAFFTWKVHGAPTISRTSLTGIGSNRPTLALTIATGSGAPALKSASIGLPSGLRFARPAGSVRVTGTNGRRVAFSLRLVAGRLQITLSKPALKIRITVGRPGISAATGLVSKVRRHRAGALTVTVRTTDAARQGAATSARIKPRN